MNERMRLIDYIAQHKNDWSQQRTKWRGKPSLTCAIIYNHHNELKWDSQRLTTKFIQDIIGVNCNENNN